MTPFVARLALRVGAAVRVSASGADVVSNVVVERNGVCLLRLASSEARALAAALREAANVAGASSPAAPRRAP